MPPELLAEWYAHYRLWPWGGQAADERLAFALANLVQAQTGGKLKNPAKAKKDPDRTPFSVDDFLIQRLPQRAGAKKRKRVRPKEDAPMSPEQTARYLAQVMGVPASALAHLGS
jgi:hypothetical protein